MFGKVVQKNLITSILTRSDNFGWFGRASAPQNRELIRSCKQVT